jgi:small subunit ribosomal protein S9
MKSSPFFIKTVGRRKTSVARVSIISGGTGKFTINTFPIEEFFIDYPHIILHAQRPIRIFRMPIVDVDANVSGGGKPSQSISLQLALARALVLVQPSIRKLFRRYRFLTPDCRCKERRKYSLKKSRKASQFSKR